MKLDEAVKLHRALLECESQIEKCAMVEQMYRANVMMMLAIIARCAIDERFEKATW